VHPRRGAAARSDLAARADQPRAGRAPRRARARARAEDGPGDRGSPALPRVLARPGRSSVRSSGALGGLLSHRSLTREHAGPRRTYHGTMSADPTSSELPAPGDHVAHYEIVRELGRGGMGAVYLARDTKLDRLVAIKFLLNAEPDFVRRFTIEARAM